MDGVRLSELIAPGFAAVHRDLKRRGHREYWFRGGRGSAKSSFVSLEIVLGLLRDPMANAIVYRRVAATLRESVYGQLAWAIEALGLSESFRFRLAPLEIEYLPTGQRILFRGADDPSKSKSIKLARGYFGYLWFEELAEFDGPESVRTIRASVLRGGKSVVLCSYNPPMSMNSWVNAEALQAREGRLVHESCYLALPEEWLGESFLEEAEQLKRSDERLYRHMYLGEITGTGGQVFGNLSLRPLTEEERGGRAYCGLDFGFAVDPDAFVRMTYDPRSRRLCITDEFWGVRTPVERLAKEIAARADGGVIRCDSADPRIIAQLREQGVNATPAKKGPGSIAAGIRWLQERSGIVIDPARCPNAAREFSAYEYVPGPEGTFLSELPDRDNHLIDAARYAAEGIVCGAARTEGKAGGVRGRTFL